MNIVRTLESLGQARKTYFDWLYELIWSRRLLLAVFVAILTGISAQLRIHLPFTPVPITGQVFMVLLSGILLGRMYGGLSMIIYVLGGFAGMPWFTGFAGGFPIGPTTGYLLGFIPAAFLIGWISQSFKQSHTFIRLLSLMIFAVSIIYFFGALHFALFMQCSIKNTLYLAVLPFIPVDLVKACTAACVARIILPE